MVTKVNFLGIKLVLHLRCLSCQPQLVYWATLHLAGCHHLRCNASMAVECELDLLGLAWMKNSMQRKNIKHLM